MLIHQHDAGNGELSVAVQNVSLGIKSHGGGNRRRRYGLYLEPTIISDRAHGGASLERPHRAVVTRLLA